MGEQLRTVRCPMHDWSQLAPDHDTAVRLLVHHVLAVHSVGHGTVRAGEPTRWIVDRSAAKLAAAGWPYIPPTGEWVR